MHEVFMEGVEVVKGIVALARQRKKGWLLHPRAMGHEEEHYQMYFHRPLCSDTC